jgi:formate hydrogenlyase subunit 4
VNAMNTLDLLTTHVGLALGLSEWNPLLRNPVMLYVFKPLVVLAWTLILHYISLRCNRVVSITARAMLVFLAIAFLVAVINNTLVILSARC